MENKEKLLQELGEAPKEILTGMLAGDIIRVSRDYTNKKTASFSYNLVKQSTSDINMDVFAEILCRQLVHHEKMIATENPEADTYDYTIKEEFVEPIKTLLNYAA